METKTKGRQNLSALNETEPNGGGDCGQTFNLIEIGRDMMANIDGLSCKTDEFKLTVNATDYNAAGDTLFVFLTNTRGYSDHRVYGIYSVSRNADIVNDLLYQTYTDYAGMSGGRGQMNFENFKPNSSNASTTFLSGDSDGMHFLRLRSVSKIYKRYPDQLCQVELE